MEKEKGYYQTLSKFVDSMYETNTCFPKKEDIFRAFNLCDLKDLKVVILGQDPYHGPNQADGLSFSISQNPKYPPSLRNIYKELYDDLKVMRQDGDLSSWANQGVLLLNTTLTVNQSSPMSHTKQGWETFTDNVIRYINDNSTNVIFVLWGSHSQKKIKLLDNKSFKIITSPHPSPLSSYRGFFGSKPFSQINDFLKSRNIKEIDWS